MAEGTLKVWNLKHLDGQWSAGCQRTDEIRMVRIRVTVDARSENSRTGMCTAGERSRRIFKSGIWGWRHEDRKNGNAARGKRGLGHQGVALIAALLILLVLTLIWHQRHRTSTFETIVSGNERRVSRLSTLLRPVCRGRSASFLPRAPFSETKLGKDSSYWSGTAGDAKKSQRAECLGLAFHHGSDLSGVGFRRFRIRVTGRSISSGAIQELEAR